ncbi:Cullin-3B, partial [Camellia lanceoleosa]
MSAQKKRNFQIESFKHRVVVDPKYAEKTWKILEHAIHEICNHNASDLSFEELYRLNNTLLKRTFIYSSVCSSSWKPGACVTGRDSDMKTTVVKNHLMVYTSKGFYNQLLGKMKRHGSLTGKRILLP